MKKIAFICTHNSCRSQIAEALCRHLRSSDFEAYSAGTDPAPAVNPTATRLMRERYGIDMAAQTPKPLAALPAIDVAVTMGCGVQCPLLPCELREDWGLPDPEGMPDEEFLQVIEQIERKVRDL